MASTDEEQKRKSGGAKIVPPKRDGDAPGDPKPGFGGEGQRSELGEPSPTGTPADAEREDERVRIAERNRRLEQERR